MDMHGHAANVHNLSGRHAQFVRWRCTISCGILKSRQIWYCIAASPFIAKV